MLFLRSTSYPLERDVLTIAYAVFSAEKLAQDGRKSIDLVIPISLAGSSAFDLPAVAGALEDAFTAVYPIPVSFQFKIADTRQLKSKVHQLDDVDAVVLFSGGVDSLAAVLNAAPRFGKVAAVFVGHSDQGGLFQVVNRLASRVLTPRQIPLQILYGPPIGSAGYSQMRGLLYLLSGVLYAHAAHAGTVIVGETGPTMYQPQFGPFDQVTMTSHPIILKAGAVIAATLPRPVRILTPFEDLTKAETIATIADQDRSDIPSTHSCISQRFRDHEGTCYGCVIRRLGTLVADSPDVRYRRDVLSDSRARIDNLVSLIRFSSDVLTDPLGIPSFSDVPIREYGKLGLFRRFAEDVFAAFYVHENAGGQFSPRVLNAMSAYPEFEELEKFAKRVNTVRSRRKRPGFGKRAVVEVPT